MKQLLLSTAIAVGAASATFAQTATPAEDLRPSGAEAFTPANAILNTAIPFAVGAREAQQSLRNAFGWPTFQEGLVQGVYFRFDPDGYARFSPSPRLDTDVFEVICRPRTFTCIARKGALALVLNNDGRVQVDINQVQATDTFALNDGFSEIQIPPRVVGVLEPQMETLLSSGGSLIVRRNDDVLEDISLAGFSAIVAYLKWVAARQDYSVLPRDWPVPNGMAPDPALTSQATNWPNTPLRSQPVFGVQQPTAQPATASAPAETPEMAALRSEVALLRDLLIAQGGQMPATMAPAAVPQPVMPSSVDVSGQDEILMQLEALRMDMGMAAQEMPAARETGMSSSAHNHAGHANTGMAGSEQPANGDAWEMMAHSPSAEVRHLHYLTVEMGFPARTALLVLQMSASGEEAPAGLMAGMASPTESLFEQLTADAALELAPEPAVEPRDTEYQLLGSYFRSVIDQ